MDFSKSEKTLEMERTLQAFIDAHVKPADAGWNRIAQTGQFPTALVDGLKEKAKAQGLWNLFLPGLKDCDPGTRLTNQEYAPLAELMGRYP